MTNKNETSARDFSIAYKKPPYKIKLSSFLAFTAVATTICIPLSISATYITLLTGLLLFLLQSHKLLETLRAPIIKPLVFLISLGFIAAFFGIQIGHSLFNLSRTAFMLLTVAFFASQFKKLSIPHLLPFLFIASSLASFHSILESAFPLKINQLFVGTVTESGQLALLIPCLAGFVFATNLNLQNNLTQKVRIAKIDLLYTLLNFIFFICLGFSNYLNLPKAIKLTLLFITSIAFCYNLLAILYLLAAQRASQKHIYTFLIRTASPLLIVALLINLKRGPWVGVTIALLIFFFFYHRRLIIPCILGLIAVAFSIAPITERLSQSSRDFFIIGGRSTIWDVGTELASQYPLGIGYKNSAFLREFAPEIPSELVHFHNNFLNVLVEFGWLGLLVFMWWIIEMIRYCFIERQLSYNTLIARGIGCSIIASQIAGIVEYNFGDSEILILLFLMLGLLISINGDKLDERP